MRMKSVFFALVYALIGLLMSGCHLAILDPKGIIAEQEKNIIVLSVQLMLIVVIPVIVLSLAFAWRYRASNAKAKYTPLWAHSTLLEVIWWTIPCIIIAILGTITWISSHKLDPYQPIVVKDTKTLRIQVIALDWKWLFIYPDQNIATVNFVQFPANVPVSMKITSEGPMNSLQIFQLAGQIYAMAGMTSQLNLIANEVGDYKGISANFSGKGFADMKFIARASTTKQFDEWVKSVKQSPNQLSMSAYNQLILPSQKNAVQYFSSANKYIFESAIMRTMMPAKEYANLCKEKFND